ncbi:hypothetical protein ACFW91_25170 [Streptomyces asoensis]|uniref:hypothetical protein n=1 Tax=Streptomyces asoensis TaxID=249586 RepID=UPI003696ECB8
MGTQPAVTGRRGTMTGEVTTGRTDLSDLLRTRKENLGVSYRDLEAACVDPEKPEAGSLWKRGTLETLVKGGGVKAPSFPQLRALAAGFRVPLSLVQAAAGAQFFGIDTVRDEEDPDVVALVHGYRGMSAEDQAWVQAIIQARRNLEQP